MTADNSSLQEESRVAMGGVELPPLPTHAGRMPWDGLRFGKPGYTADQMRAFYAAGVKAERERCAKICEKRAEDCRDEFASDGDERWLVYAKHARRLAATIRAQSPSVSQDRSA
jgi:hypothetical protein